MTSIAADHAVCGSISPSQKNLPDIVACQGGLVFSGLSENGVQRTNAILSAGSP